MPTNAKKVKLHDDLIASILNEDRVFNMDRWLTDEALEDNVTATCDTASCMAGHLEAIRPELAEKLREKYTVTERRFMGGHAYIDHPELARELYEIETGEPCTLDFYAFNHPAYLGEQTREDAVAHIRGEHPEWPQRNAEDER